MTFLNILHLERTSNEINASFDGIRERHQRLKFNMKNNTGHIRTMKEQSRSKFIRLKGILSTSGFCQILTDRKDQ